MSEWTTSAARSGQAGPRHRTAALTHGPEITVLIVEDSRVEQLRMRTMLSAFGYRVMCADNGSEALAILAAEHIPLVVSDWRMPEVSGLDLCRALRAEGALGQPYVILVTGNTDPTDLVAGMDAGADDFIGKPFNREELRVRVQAGARIVQLRSDAENRNAELAESLRREADANQLIRQDLDAAATMQRQLLPRDASPFPTIETGSLFHPAVEVAGDCFNFFRLDDKHLGFYHIDVSGHGVASAMLSFTVAHFLAPQSGGITLRVDAAGGENDVESKIVAPESVVDALNERFLDKDGLLYFTMVYGVLNVTSGSGSLCQAGHPHPLIVESSGSVRRVGAGGFPVGMLASAHYESVEFQLNRRARLYLYSDGVTDCRNDEGSMLSEARLTDLLSLGADKDISAVIPLLDQQLRHWRGEQPPEDDISLLAIGRTSQSKPMKDRL